MSKTIFRFLGNGKPQHYLMIMVVTVFVVGCAKTEILSHTTPLTVKDYANAERFQYENVGKYIANGSVKHHWIGNTDQFWYSRDTATGKEFVIVEAATGQKRLAFDHAKLAEALTNVSDAEVDAGSLDVENYLVMGERAYVEVMAGQKKWTCDLSKITCLEVQASNITPGDLPSPDGKWAIFTKDHNLYLRSLVNGSVRQLTTDGTKYHSYGKISGTTTMSVTLRRMGIPLPPVAVWSSDSKKVVSHRIDERLVKDLHLLQYAPETGSARPVLHSYRYSMPGDKNNIKSDLYIYDVIDGTQVKVDYSMDVLYISPLAFGRVWWNADNSQVYVLPTEASGKTQKFLSVDAKTGDIKKLIEETGSTYVDVGTLTGTVSVRTLSNGQIIWYSERDGWGHLYRYDNKGLLINQITSGTWQVRNIIFIDEDNQKVIFTAGGREEGQDPYFTHLYEINMDGSNLQKLTSGKAHHEITAHFDMFMAKVVPGAPGKAEASFSPSGKFFVETQSTPGTPPVTILKSAKGDVISIVEKADISKLEEGGFVKPEQFGVLAADGKTKIYGNIFRPSTFDPEKSYPVIDSIYPGPQAFRAAKDFIPAVFGGSAQSLAELGFIVVTIDGRGTPGRSKAFHDVSYGKLGQAGNLKDHIAGITQLAKRYPYMDLSRVGIYGHSGGGYASTRALFDYPDFYKVAVSSAGNHDQRGYLKIWGETYQGPFTEENFIDGNNTLLAEKLKGKLLLVHGDMDDNVHPALTMQVVNALIKANKDFDMLILPNQGHNFNGASKTYFTRKRWNYFVKHLLGVEPIKDYWINSPIKRKFN